MIGVRRISSPTKHGRKPSARGSPDRVNDVSQCFISRAPQGAAPSQNCFEL
jgi:hypothetical protein